MTTESRINQLIKTTIQRAVRESVAGLIVLLLFAYFLQLSSPGTARYYGCLLVLLSVPFSLGIIWSNTLSYRLLQTHATTDTTFWQEAFRAQARLLRTAPLWYLAPACAGTMLVFSGKDFAHAGTGILAAVTIFSRSARRNRTAAFKLDEGAALLAT